jgi:DNA invertase Pin-like site-specific DNA recombinase
MNTRNQAIVKLKEKGLSYAQIADAYGISRQRVFQIVNKKKRPSSNNGEGNETH